MSDIFISYAREDREKARAIAAVFEGQGWSVWWDRNIPPGRSFDQVIEEALAAARCVVVLWSKSSATSDWVKTEAAEGLARKILVPVRTEEINLPLEFRRLQTVDLTRWSGDAADPALREFLDAVAALLKSEVRPAPAPVRRKTPVKPVYFALAALVALAVGWSLYKFSGTRGRPQPSPTPLEEHVTASASPNRDAESKSSPVPDLMRTPELGLEFWQQNQECLMFIVDWETSKTRVVLKPGPFEIRCPRFKEAVQICAWSDASIFDEIADGKKLADIAYFTPGTGMADSTFGTPRLRLENQAHNYFVDSRHRAISEHQDSIFVSSLVRGDETLTTWPTTYLVIFVDLDQNGEVRANEFECVELDFSK
jgi:TIR domain